MRWRRMWGVIALPIAFFVTLAAWAVTSPVGSAPDDDFHLASIWCAAGERAGVCQIDADNPNVRLVPESVGIAQQCFASDPAVTAACTDQLTDSLIPTERVNSVVSIYPGGFYRVMGVLVGPDVAHSVMMMRLLNAVIAAGLLALAVIVLNPAIRSSVALVVAVVFVPLGLFVLPSTNPSSWTVTGVTFLWAFGSALSRCTSWRSVRTWLLFAATIVSAGLAIGSRVDAAAYVVIVVTIIFLLAGPRQLRRSWKSAAVLVALAIIGLIRFRTHGTPGSGVSGGMGGSEPGIGLLLSNIVNLPVYLTGAMGGMPLGWNDTALPAMVAVFGVLAFGALTYRGLTVMSKRKAVAASAAFVALVLVPLVFLQREGLGVGEVVQARYLLPLVIVLFATLNLAVPFGRRVDPGIPMLRSFAWIVGLAMSASAGLSLWVNAHRYASGSLRGLFDIDVQLEWTGLTSLPLPITVGIGVVATTAYVASALAVAYRDGGSYGARERTGSPTTASHPVQ